MTLSPRAETMRRRISNPFALWFWLLVKLPAAWWCGVRLREITTGHCVTSVPYGWRSQNPFRSTYFAALAMAAELSTGALVLLAAEDAGVAMSTLIIDMRASYGKKATGLATFRCDGGEAVFRAISEAKASGEARTIALETVGTMDDGTEVARFVFTWSMKPRSSAPRG
ncbi:MAG: DUF4442 domain-containing protein [Deltaproteobacteria bacterium]|nr:DUF4442 domain-containing protein [Deltaproteobacteria bacterium]